MIKSIKKIYSKEYLILIGIGFLPLIWKILEIAFLSSFDNALKILGQIALISIIYKIFEESLLNPLYKLLGKDSYNTIEDKNAIAKKFLLWYLGATTIFTILIFLFANPIMQISKVPEYIFAETIDFLRVYIVSCGLGIISKYLYTFSIISKDTKKMLVYLIIKAVATAMLFVLFIPTFALGMGVMGIAIAELIVNMATILYLVFTFPKTQNIDAKIDTKEYLKLLIFAFSETLIRNVVYYFVILVFLNMLDNQDLYFISNEYIWSIMVVPTLSQSTLIKQDISANRDFTIKPYFVNCIFLILFMIVLIPLAIVIFKYIYNIVNYIDYFVVLLKLFPCYIIFVVDSVIEAYFFATGKLHHILIQGIITNVLIYLVAYILYLCSIWIPTLDTIILLFNLGVIVSSIYTISIYIFERKKNDSNTLIG